ncbi:MAG TPA: PEP-CTERM sorting domain-containing protein [Rhodanobacteraceae bacterium]|nr:PEP-CTERM sorting domain-containing protein [Rhodanobacteraceae bacterium]
MKLHGKLCENIVLNRFPTPAPGPAVGYIYSLDERLINNSNKNNDVRIGMPRAGARDKEKAPDVAVSSPKLKKHRGTPTMKRYLFLALSAIVLAMLVAPDALAVRIRIADPTGDPVVLPPNNFLCDGSSAANSNIPCNIYTLGEPAYQVTFVSCDTTGIPTQTPPPDFSYCLWLNNVTGTPVNKLTFEFTVPEGGSLDGTDVLTCDAEAADVEDFSATNTCHGTASAEDRLKITFFTNPAVGRGSDFYLYTDFKKMPDPALVTVSVAVPEPGALGMFGLGLLLLGVGYGWQRRRQHARQGGAA